jgi:eukaryotic-like serine/threonine-protein kinase
VDRRVDIYAASVLISELFAGRRLNEPKDVGDALARATSAENEGEAEGPMREVLARGRSKNPNDRYPTAGDMADAIEASGELASEREVAEWLRLLVGSELDERRARWEAEGGVAVAAEQAPQTSDATVSAVAIAPPSPPPIEEGAATEVDRPETQPEPRTRAPLVVLALAGIAGAAIGVWLIFRGEVPAVSARAGLPDAVSVVPPASERAEEPAERPSAVAVVSSEPTTDAPVASTPPKQARPSARPKKPNLDCDPPYKLDHRGVKVLKLECLR